MFDTPILYLIFNRPDLTEITFPSICKIKPKKLFIAADGPRFGNLNDEISCKLVREYVLSKIDWDCQVQTLFRDKNLGCGKAVSSAITWFFTYVEAGIILEDDCLPDNSFFRFCEELLKFYENDHDVMSISGSNLQGTTKYINGASYFWNLGGVWGWATWKRSWLKYDYYMNDFNALNEIKIKNYFKNNISFQYYNSLFKQFYDGYIDTWDIQWVFSIIINKGIAINPRINLVKNLGFGINATHTTSVNNYLNKLESYEINFPLVHPRNKKINFNYLIKTIKKNSFYESRFLYCKKLFKLINKYGKIFFKMDL
jgi:hypothetical protein